LNEKSVAGVTVPPPLLYGIPLAAGLLLNHAHPRPILPDAIATVAGPFLVALGLIVVPAILAFRRAGTSPKPWRPTTALVTGGPYKISRNPMYLGFTLVYLGASVWANSLWPVLALPIVLVVMNRQIAREEAYLERLFGDDFRRYKVRVRRWI
jgi:protein-S-isoprenylcysteine O-methyltransferase Ste14